MTGQTVQYRSARDAAGHDVGRIHAVRVSPLTGFTLTLCGATFGRNGYVSHDIGPTCKRCRAAGIDR